MSALRGISLALATGVGLCLLALAPRVAAAQAAEEPQQALESGRYEEAIRVLEAMQRRGTATAADVGNLLRAHMRLGRYDEAVAIGVDFGEVSLEAAAEVATEIGRAHHARGRRDEAERYYRAAIAGGAANALTARVQLAVLDFERGRRDAAEAGFDALIDAYNAGRMGSAADLMAVARACEYLGRDNPQLFHDAVRALDEAIYAAPNDPEPRLRLGRLFLAKYDGAEAERLLAEALQLDPQFAQAHVAEAERLQFAGSPDALGRVRQALGTNPNSVAAHVLEGRLLLTAGNRDDAAAAAERALEVDPGHAEALGIVAAARFLADDETGYREALRRARETHPGSAVAYRTVAEMAAQNRLYAEAVEIAAAGVEIDPQAWDAWGELGLNQLRTGAIDAGRVSLERAFAGDPFNVWFKNTLDLLDTFSDYRTVATEHFELFLREDRADLLAPYLGDVAERAWSEMTARYGYAPEVPVRIEVYERHADFSVRTVGLAGVGALGVAFGPVVAVDAPAVPGMGEYNWASTLWHEVAHVVAMGLSRNRVPRWFTEGLSVYEERRGQAGWGEDPDPGFLLAYLRGDLLPASRINEGFYRPRYPQHVQHSYVQGSLVFELFDEEFGFDVVPRMLAAYGEGAGNLEAVERVVGWDGAEFDRRFDEYMRTRYAGPLAALETDVAHGAPAHAEGEESASAPGGSPAAPDLETLRADADKRTDSFLAQLRVGALLVRNGRLDEAETYLRRAKRLFPEYAGPDSPYLLLARVHAERGEQREAIQELGTLVTLSDRHLEARLWLADMLQAEGATAAAAAALESVFMIDVDRPDELRRVAELHAEAGNWPAAVRARRALLGLDPVDRAGAFYELARAQMEAGDLAGARRSVLGALELAPSYPAAQELLLELRARREETS